MWFFAASCARHAAAQKRSQLASGARRGFDRLTKITTGWTMRRLKFALFGFLSVLAFAPAARADLLVLAPGVIQNGGIKEATDAFTKQTGIKVQIKSGGMNGVVTGAESGNPPPDVVFLPMEPYDLLGNLALKSGIKTDTFTPIARVEFGLAVRKGDLHPDISTPEKFIAVLKSAKQVMRSNPGNDHTPGAGSMVALAIDEMLAKPDFAGVKSKISTNGEGGMALGRGEGDMALQAICEIINHPEIELVGVVPAKFYLHMDMAAAVSSRTGNEKDARAYLAFIQRPEIRAIWKEHGLDRF
jgi:molybdate transport system substrate-binding protein